MERPKSRGAHVPATPKLLPPPRASPPPRVGGGVRSAIEWGGRGPVGPAPRSYGGGVRGAGGLPPLQQPSPTCTHTHATHTPITRVGLGHRAQTPPHTSPRAGREGLQPPRGAWSQGRVGAAPGACSGTHRGLTTPGGASRPPHVVAPNLGRGLIKWPPSVSSVIHTPRRRLSLNSHLSL